MTLCYSYIHHFRTSFSIAMRIFCRYDYASKMINTKIQSILPEMRQLTDRTEVVVKAFDIAMLNLPTSWRASYTKKMQKHRPYCHGIPPLFQQFSTSSRYYYSVVVRKVIFVIFYFYCFKLLFDVSVVASLDNHTAISLANALGMA